MPLHSQYEALLSQLASAGGPALSDMPVSAGREMYRMMQPAAPDIEVGKVEDRKIPGPGGPIPVRIYTPKASPQNKGGPFPIFMNFHGGGWVIGDLDTADSQCRDVCNLAQCVVVSVDYRLAPEHKFPAAVDDCLAAYRWLRERGREVGVDTGRVGVGGDSAGGNLAAVVCQLARGQGLALPACQVLIYPATDFTLDTPSHRELEHGHIIPRDRIVWYAQQYLRNEADKLDERASPIRGEMRGLPPALIITAGFDPLRDEGHRYAEALRKGGTDVQCHEYEGQIHAFVSLTKAIPQGMTATLEIADYLRARL